MSSRGNRAKAALAPKAGESVAEFHACDRKRRFATSVEAKKAASRSAKKKDAPQLYTYQCEYCGGWHLTHRKPKK